MKLWTTCSSCAGPNRPGFFVPHSGNYRLFSRSLDGSSARVSIWGTTSHGDAMWRKELGGTDTRYFNSTYGSRGRSGGSEINNTFQADQTRSHTAYSVWLDEVTLKQW